MEFSFLFIYDSLIALIQLIVAVFITWYMLRLSGKSSATWWLTVFFGCVTLVVAAFFLESSLIFWGDMFYAAQVWLGLCGQACLIQFAYHFPRNDQPREARTVLWVSLLTVLMIAGVALYTSVLFLRTAPEGDAPLLVLFVLYLALPFGLFAVVGVLLRRMRHLHRVALAAANRAPDHRPGFWQVLSRPASSEVVALRSFAGIMLFGFVPATSTLLLVLGIIATPTAAYFTGLGLLLVLLALFLTYLNHAREPTSFTARVFTISLVLLLALFGIVALITISARNEQFQYTRNWQIVAAHQAILRGDLARLPPEVAYVVVAPLPTSTDVTPPSYQQLYPPAERAPDNVPMLSGLPEGDWLRHDAYEELDHLHIRTIDYVHELTTLPAFDSMLRYGDQSRQTIPRYAGYQVVEAGNRYEIGFYLADDLAYINQENLQLGILLLASSLLLGLALPRFFRVGLVQPLNALLAGVQRANAGDLNVVLPVRYQDEIGHLTHEFNRMIATQHGMTRQLEQRVAERTAELEQANARLREESAERERIAAALRDSEEKYRNVSERANDGIIIVQDGLIQYCNSRLAAMLARPIDAIQGAPALSFIHPDYREIVHNRLTQRTQGDSVPTRYEIELLCSDGQGLAVEINAGLMDYTGHPAVLAFVRDMSERKQTEAALRAREAQYRLLAENIHDVVWTLNGEGQFTYVSPSVFALRGYTSEEVLQQPLHAALTPASLQLVHSRISQANETGHYKIERLELEQFCKDGSTIWTECVISPLLDEAGRLNSWVGVARDISERRRTDEKLHQLSQAVEQSPVSVVITDTTGAIEYVNPKFTQVTGYTFEEALGQNPRILKSGLLPREIYSDLWQTLLAGKEWRGELHNRKKNGDYYWESASISPILNVDGVITHFLAVKEDITELRQAAQDLQQAKERAEAANRAKSTFLANMSHELRTPLNAILGFARLIHRSPGLAAEHRDHIGIIYRNGEHLLTLINSVLDLSKIEAGRMTLQVTSFDLYCLLSDLEDMFRLRTQDKGLLLICECAPDVPQYVRTDEVKLRQVLINLLSNAVKFTSEGGITLRVRVQYPPGEAHRPVELLDLQAAEQAEAAASCDTMATLICEVEDSGPGIASNEIDQLFEAFVQTSSGQQSHGGTGLGLAISRKFVQLMGGDIGVRSEVNSGTCFRVTIQIQLALAHDLQRHTEPGHVVGLAPDQPAYRLLIVDDRQDARSLLIKRLAPLGFEVREAANGQEAIDIWSIWQPHLIWMDMRMPVLDGYEATRHIKATSQGQSTVIVALTASAFDEERDLVLGAGCDDFVRKPFRDSEIFDVMQKYLGIRYIYDDDGQEQQPTTPPLPDEQGRMLLPAALGALPAELLIELEQAAIRADMAHIASLIDQIGTFDTSLGSALQALAANFEYDQLLNLIEQCKGGREWTPC